MPRLMVNEDYSGNGMDWGKKSRKQEDWDRDVHLNNQVNISLNKMGRWTTKIYKLNKIDSTND